MAKRPQTRLPSDQAGPSTSAGQMRAAGGLLPNLKLYVSRQAASPARYAWEQMVLAAAGWVPALPGVALRSVAYKSILTIDGVAAIEARVRLRYASHIHLGDGFKSAVNVGVQTLKFVAR